MSRCPIPIPSLPLPTRLRRTLTGRRAALAGLALALTLQASEHDRPGQGGTKPSEQTDVRDTPAPALPGFEASIRALAQTPEGWAELLKVGELLFGKQLVNGRVVGADGEAEFDIITLYPVSPDE